MGFCHFQNYTALPRRCKWFSSIEILSPLTQHRWWFCYEKDSEFITKGTELFEFCKLPLQRAGNYASATEFLLEFHDMVSYALKYFDLSNTDYWLYSLICVVWHRLFESCRWDEWKSILLQVKLLFTLPVSNVKVERRFSLMNRIKTDSRNSLSQQRLSSILRICMEGPTSQEFDPKPAMQLWSDGVGARRPNQSQRKKYKRKKPEKHGPTTFIDLSSSEEESSGELSVDL